MSMVSETTTESVKIETYIPILSQKRISTSFPVQTRTTIIEHPERDFGTNI